MVNALMHGNVVDEHALVFYSTNHLRKFCAGNVNHLTINLLQFFRARGGRRLLKSVKNADTKKAHGLDWGLTFVPLKSTRWLVRRVDAVDRSGVFVF